MVRFIHTADLQIGKQFEYLAAPADKLAFLRQARIDTIKAIGEIAKQREATAVLVAGDVFERSELRDIVIRQALSAMAGTQIDWVLLPGNHDPDGPAGIWDRIRKIGCPANVRLACGTDPLVIASGTLAILPAPLSRRHQFADPTGHFDSVVTPSACIRVGLAHGSVQNRMTPAAETHNMISEIRADQARLDYLALGDWHSMREIASRTWYSGTPEPDDFDQASGYVLLVEVAGPQEVPSVEPIRVGRYTWQRIEATLQSPDAPAALRALLGSIGCPHEHAVIDLRLRGTVSLAERNQVDELVANMEATVQVLRTNSVDLRNVPSESDLDELGRHGYVSQVVSRLRSLSENVADPDSRFAETALHRLYIEHATGGR